MEKIICVFGDSTSWGAWDTEKGGWVNRLWFYLAENNYDHHLYNLSISGGTTETLLARFESESKIREADVLIFQTGGNDASREKSRNGRSMVEPDIFKTNLEEIVIRAKKITNEIIFIGFDNCDESKTTPVSWRELYYTNKDIKKYNEIMRRVCETNNVLYLDIFGILDDNDLKDGLHPNAGGHRKTFEKVKDFLLKHKII